MPPPGQTPHDPYRPEQGPPPQPWRSPWSEEPAPLNYPGKRRSRDEQDHLGPFDDDYEVYAGSSPLIQELNASFARQRQRQMNYLVAFAVFVFSFTVLAWVYVRDDDRPWDSDLPVAKPDIAARINPAPDRLREALETAKASDSDANVVLSPPTWDTPSLSREVGAHEECFIHLKALLNDEDWQPTHPAWKETDLGAHANWQALGTAKEAAAAYYSRRGQDEAAMLAGMELALLANKLESISAWPSYYARGVEVHERACKAIASMLRQNSMDARTLSKIQAEFEGITPSDDVLKARIMGFYDLERHLLVGLRPGDPWSQPMAGPHNKLFFKPNHTVQLFAASMRELADQVARVPTPATGQIAQRVGRAGHPAGLPFGPNRDGMKYLNQRVWNYAGLLDHMALQRTRHALVLTLFGVRRFALDHGRAPQKLEELIPRYFTALPADPFTGEPFHYNAAKGLIYSVGTNFRDEGGKDNDDPLSDNTEPTVMVRASEP